MYYSSLSSRVFAGGNGATVARFRVTWPMRISAAGLYMVFQELGKVVGSNKSNIQRLSTGLLGQTSTYPLNVVRQQMQVRYSETVKAKEVFL
ncbi:hypothetical protein HAX54_013240 [Datura stramonium]|uniref:Uncharacterized protein n=1 Tax=Datura stramonium TaxID=4076 RepID=A0ABS8TMT8_DATST|nr:hypothetical protein [Datura stramonium]